VTKARASLSTFSHSTQTMCAGGSVRGLLHFLLLPLCVWGSLNTLLLQPKEMLCVRGCIHSAVATGDAACVRGFVRSVVATGDAVCAWLCSLSCCHWRCCVCVALFALLLPLEMLCVRGCVTLAMHFHHADVLRTQCLEHRSPSEPSCACVQLLVDQRV
jgi:hypothetical protein